MTSEQDIEAAIAKLTGIERGYFATQDNGERDALLASSADAEKDLRRTLALLGFVRIGISFGAGETLEAKRIGQVNIRMRDGFRRAFFTSAPSLKETAKRHATNARVRRQMEHSI
jgi:hypothetical protein